MFLAACSSQGTTSGTTSTTTSSSSTGSGGSGGSGPSCTDPTTPSSACGALTFAISDVTSRKRNHHGTFLATTKAGTSIYVAGGANGQVLMNNVDRYTLNADGSVKAGVSDTPLPKAIGGFTGEVISNVLVVAGGTLGNTVQIEAYASVIGDDGTLGAWSDVGSVVHPRMHPGSVAHGNTIYVMGGFQDP